MKYADAKKLHNGDEVIVKKDRSSINCSSSLFTASNKYSSKKKSIN